MWLYVVADWETFYSTKERYSLRVQDTASYILDPRFEEIGCSFKVTTDINFCKPAFWVDALEVPGYLAGLRRYADEQGLKIVFINHNTLFDACIASWRHGFLADVYVDTLAMSRALLGHELHRHDLDSVARHLGVGVKGQTVHKVNGMRRADIIAAGIYWEYAGYCNQDSELCWGIFQKLFPVMPVPEVAITDMVLRLAIQPRLKLDQVVLHEHLAQVRAEKDQLLASAGLDMSTPEGKAQSISSLMSNDRLAEILISMGVTPPEKPSPSDPTKITWAFAKTDDGMKELLEHPDIAVQTLIAARLGHKSTQEETRTERFLAISNLWYPAAREYNLFPVALKVSGAHTHRLSGDWRLNQQNLPRPSRRRPRAMLRESIVAAPGRMLLAGDESQVEARTNALFCGQLDLVEEFARGEDPYCNFGTKVFGFPITKANVPERFCSKTAVLSCGYQVGWRKYQASIKHLSMEQTGVAIVLSDDDARRHINMYREDKWKIAQMWGYLHHVVIPALAIPSTDFMLGPVRVMYEKIVLPNGLCLHYRQLHKDPNGQWWFVYGRRMKKLYGGKLLENIIQALTRIILMDAALRLRKPMREQDAYLVMQVHDELVYDVPEDNVAVPRQMLEAELRRRPIWMPDLPLACETGVGRAYGKAK